MSARSVRIEGTHDQMVLFTLVELMTHLIFLALILGFALRKEADPVYQRFTAKCGLNGELCVVRPKDGPKPGGQDLANCLGKGQELLKLRALGSGGFSVAGADGLPASVAANPQVAALLARQTLSKAELGRLGRAVKKAANGGELGAGACNFAVSLCRDHRNSGQYESQYNLAAQFFYVPGPRACRR